MPFPSRDLTNQYISTSYQDVVQRYVPAGTASYFLDGFGNELMVLDNAAAGQKIITVGQTASYALNTVSASHTTTAILAQVADVAILAETASLSISSSYSSNASNSEQAVSASNVFGTIVSASYIITNSPTEDAQVATKEYVDNINPQGLEAFFRSGVSDVPDHYRMHDLGTPLSASAVTISQANVSASQYIFSFASNGIGVTNINQGNFPVHFHAWFTGPGNSALSVAPEFWLLSASVARLIATEAPIVLNNTVDREYTGTITLTSSIVTHPTERAIIKFRAVNVTNTPDAFMNVDGQTSAGVRIPVPSSNFVLRAGDTMTGNLTVPRVIGTASYADLAITASYAMNGGGSSLITGSTYPITASWAQTSSYSLRSLSSSYAATASWLNNASINVPNGVAGLDSSGNLSATVIPLQDTETNLGNIILSSGAPAYATDTRDYFIGDGTSSISSLDTITKFPQTGSIRHKAYFIPIISVPNGTTSSLALVTLPVDNSIQFSMFEVRVALHNNADGEAYHYNFENSYLFNNDELFWSPARVTSGGNNALATLTVSGSDSNIIACIVNNPTNSDLHGFLKVEYTLGGMEG